MKYFNSNETLDMCDVHVSDNGKIVISTKSYHSAALERLGDPERAIRGRVKVEKESFVFEPYAEASRHPTYKKKAVVGSTTIAVTDGNVKLSLVVSRNYTKEMLTRLIEAEIEEVIRRLKEDLYDAIVRTPSESSQARRFCEPKGSVSATDAFASAPSMGSTQSPLN